MLHMYILQAFSLLQLLNAKNLNWKITGKYCIWKCSSIWSIELKGDTTTTRSEGIDLQDYLTTVI